MRRDGTKQSGAGEQGRRQVEICRRQKGTNQEVAAADAPTSSLLHTHLQKTSHSDGRDFQIKPILFMFNKLIWFTVAVPRLKSTVLIANTANVAAVVT